MSDLLDSIMDYFHQLADAGLSLQDLSFSEIVDMLADAGMDVSQLSDAEVDALTSAMQIDAADAVQAGTDAGHADSTNGGSGEVRFGSSQCPRCWGSGVWYGAVCNYCNGNGVW